MTNPYKIECPDIDSANIVCCALLMAKAKYVREGSAVLTNHSFTQEQADNIWSEISALRPYEDLTKTDLEVWDNE